MFGVKDENAVLVAGGGSNLNIMTNEPHKLPFAGGPGAERRHIMRDMHKAMHT